VAIDGVCHNYGYHLERHAEVVVIEEEEEYDEDEVEGAFSECLSTLGCLSVFALAILSICAAITITIYVLATRANAKKEAGQM
jgi:hypothetical protein